jgi:hypothetical protein
VCSSDLRQKRRATSAKKKAEREERKRKRLEGSSGVYKSKSPDEKRKTQKRTKKWKKFNETVQGVRKALNESMIAYVFQNPPSSEDAHIWDSFISKLSRDVVMSDKTLGGILNTIASTEADVLGKAASHVCKSLSPKFPTSVKQISRDPQGEILVDLQSLLPESNKTVVFSVKLDNSKPVVYFSDEAKRALNLDVTQETKLLRAELIHCQETKLNEMDDVIKQLEQRNEYLREMKLKCSEMFEGLSPLETEVFRSIFRSKKKPKQVDRFHYSTNKELETGEMDQSNDEEWKQKQSQEVDKEPQ